MDRHLFQPESTKGRRGVLSQDEVTFTLTYLGNVSVHCVFGENDCTSYGWRSSQRVSRFDCST